MDSGIVICLRIHRNNVKDRSAPIDLSVLREACRSTSAYASRIAIAYPEDDVDLGIELQGILPRRLSAAPESGSASIDLVPVRDWGKFIPALNSLVHYAAQQGFDIALFQSVEVRLADAEIEAMRAALVQQAHHGPSFLPSSTRCFYRQDALVVGKALNGHNFVAGKQSLDGRTAPWNTAALWNVQKLALTGFLMVAEGLIPGVEGGVEEVSVIALHQRLKAESSRAVLIQFNDSSGAADGWNASWYVKRGDVVPIRSA
ncbi:uncharacterized protein BJ171DRAFT_578712 [Polychytrium aggregatum]|uniref:uncharacterized protein n=1 Tax=Polychytrium aggregatum TaxID=110093 RepID=UPI0022FDE401|nr:uncharacterized protein BJ171DRAFT_578712 [Polychytrium aggregatum]KAI9207597.1 hypothetical protein BJ171DRAFT_578712 [Polychytrium aggregatum]